HAPGRRPGHPRRAAEVERRLRRRRQRVGPRAGLLERPRRGEEAPGRRLRREGPGPRQIDTRPEDGGADLPRRAPRTRRDGPPLLRVGGLPSLNGSGPAWTGALFLLADNPREERRR